MEPCTSKEKIFPNLDPSSIVHRKESPMNPYNRSTCAKISACWLPIDTDHNEINLVNSLPELDSVALPKSYMESCSCSPRRSFDRDHSDDSEEHAGSPRNVGCCATQWTRKNAYQKIKAKVQNAVKRHKIFLIRGELPKLKEALEERGWVQKYETTKTRNFQYGSVVSLEARSLGDITQLDGTLNEKAVVFALLRHITPDFIWDCRNDFVEWHHGLPGNVLLNRYQKPSVYTSKLGMAHLLDESRWFCEKGVSRVLFPRSYNLSKDPKAFLEDFRVTAAVGLLKWFVQRMQDGEDITDLGNHPIPPSRLEFAIKRCEEFVARLNHQDVDEDLIEDISEEDWNLFLNDYNAVLHEGNGLDSTAEGFRDLLQKCFVAAVSTLTKLKAVDPEYELSGMRNIWILKPSELCCGTGISISHNLRDIFRRVKGKPKDYFVVQKYIERPLLIQRTKFDIRQWYLVTSTFPLTIWIYKEGLLRFSSKPYTFSTYHEAIHICNTAIQEKYDEERRRRRKRGNIEEVVKSVRDQGWDCDKLNEYLKEVGYEGEPYYDTIYPKMAEAIVMTMLVSQEYMDRRRCSFELYGADFVIMDDLSVWLIEINTNPRMHPPSSRITKRLYSGVLESLVKVVLDVPLNEYADTGGFNPVYKQNIPDFRPYLGPSLFVFGKSITLQENPRKRERKTKGNGTCKKLQQKQQRAWTAPPTIPRIRDPKIVDFIDYLNTARCTAAN